MKWSLRVLFFSLVLILQSSWALAQSRCSEIFKDATNSTGVVNEVIFGQGLNERVFAIIRTATKTLDIETASIPGERFYTEVLARANSGVKVRLLLDGRHYLKDIANKALFDNGIGHLVHPNIEIRLSNPQELSMARSYRESVLHRKIAIVDGRIAYMGSSNLTSNDNFEVGLISRDQVNELQKIFDHDFSQVTDRWQDIKNTIPLEPVKQIEYVGPGTSHPEFKPVSLELIRNAQQTLWLSALDISQNDVVQALIQRHKSNPDLDIRVVITHVPMKYPFAGKYRDRNMNASSANALINAGIPVRWYEVPSKAIIHGRTVITDTSVMGSSADLTERAFSGNIDLGFITQDASIRNQLKTGFLELWETSTPAQIEKESLESFFATRFENWIVPRLKPKGLRSETSIKGQITYGYEVEFVPDINSQIFNFYRLPKFTEDTWLQLTPQQRITEFQTFLADYPKLLRTVLTSLGRLNVVKLQNAPEYLPEKLLIESHGTVEAVGEVFTDSKQMADKIHLLVKILGKGYWQSHVVFPKEYSSYLSGFIAFSTDHAYLSSLTKSYEKFKRDPESIPGVILTHYALGHLSQKGFQEVIENNERSLLGKNVGKGGTQRLINGPALRDDAYPKGLVGMELRQFSVRHEEMLSEVDFVTNLLIKNQMFLFNAFKEIKLLDFKVYEQLTPDRAERWKPFFRRMDRYFKGTSASSVVGGASYEERLLTPLRDWKNHPVVQHTGLSASEIAQAQMRIEDATNVFKAEVDQIIAENRSEKESAIALRISVSKWASATGLESLFSNFRARIENQEKSSP